MNDPKMIGQFVFFFFLQVVVAYPICKIYQKAGFKWFWGLVSLVPLAGFFAILGALGFSNWPSTSQSANPTSNGQHTLLWVAAFSAIFLFGIPGAQSQDNQATITLVFAAYMTLAVGLIYANAGYSMVGGLMGLLGITNLIWPWLIAFRNWPKLRKNLGESQSDSLDSSVKMGVTEMIHVEKSPPGNQEGTLGNSPLFTRPQQQGRNAVDSEIDSEWFYTSASGVPHGPRSYEEIEKLYRSGEIKEETMIWTSSQTSWLPYRVATAKFRKLE